MISMKNLAIASCVVFMWSGGCLSANEASTQAKADVKRYPFPAWNPSAKQVKWGYVDSEGNPSIPAEFDEVSEFQKNVAMVRVGRKWGLINTTGAWITKPTYEAVEQFSDGLAAVRVEDGRWGFIDSNGNLVVKPIYAKVTRFSEGLAGAFEDRSITARGGYINKEGKYTIAREFHDLNPFSNGLAIVRDYGGRNERVINQTGHVVFQFVDCTPWGTREFREGLLCVSFFDIRKYGFVDIGGHRVGDLYDGVAQMSEGLAAVKKDGLWGFVDPKGELRIPFAFKVDKDGKPGSLASNGFYLVTQGLPPAFTEGLAFVRTANGWAGFISPKGEKVTEIRDKGTIGPFHNSLAPLFIEGDEDDQWDRFCYIDRKGQRKFEYRVPRGVNFSNPR